MIWAPTAGGGPDNGFRYLDALHTLDIPEIVEVFDHALAEVEKLAHDPRHDLGDWRGHGPALSAYAMWAVSALESHGAIGIEDAKHRLQHLAKLQQRGGLHPDHPGIHNGRSAGWLAPPWWGTQVHAHHQALLIATHPTRYSPEVFARGAFAQPVPTNSRPL